MECYQCGCRLSEHDFCTGCGADVSLYKQILSASNRSYNEGLEKATVRDLSGAIIVLRQSLKFNKNNIEARNLLGLVYFETGETVAALSEWVISKNIRPQRNIADDYITMIQTNQSRLDTINQTIKKYNQALAYCCQESQDLAVIQLKKVLSYNPKYVRAHQLLALLYIQSEEWAYAKNELYKCIDIDTNNTITLRYLREVNNMMLPEENVKGGGSYGGNAFDNNNKRKRNTDEAIRYQSGNETIIQPGKTKEYKGAASLFNVGIGVVIGIAIACSLILPARIQQAKAAAKDEVKAVSEQMDAKTATIDELELKAANLEKENTRLAGELSDYQGAEVSTMATDNLLLAAGTYLTQPADLERIGTYMDAITQEDIADSSAAFEDLYQSLVSVIGIPLSSMYYDIGYADYQAEDYVKAIPNLLKAYQYDNLNGDALFYLANAYKETADYDRAKEAYARVIEDFPQTRKAENAETYLVEINMTLQTGEGGRTPDSAGTAAGGNTGGTGDTGGTGGAAGNGTAGDNAGAGVPPDSGSPDAANAGGVPEGGDAAGGAAGGEPPAPENPVAVDPAGGVPEVPATAGDPAAGGTPDGAAPP